MVLLSVSGREKRKRPPGCPGGLWSASIFLERMLYEGPPRAAGVAFVWCPKSMQVVGATVSHLPDFGAAMAASDARREAVKASVCCIER